MTNIFKICAFFWGGVGWGVKASAFCFLVRSLAGDCCFNLFKLWYLNKGQLIQRLHFMPNNRDKLLVCYFCQFLHSFNTVDDIMPLCDTEHVQISRWFREVIIVIKLWVLWFCLQITAPFAIYYIYYFIKEKTATSLLSVSCPGKINSQAKQARLLEKTQCFARRVKSWVFYKAE